MKIGVNDLLHRVKSKAIMQKLETTTIYAKVHPSKQRSKKRAGMN